MKTAHFLNFDKYRDQSEVAWHLQRTNLILISQHPRASICLCTKWNENNSKDTPRPPVCQLRPPPDSCCSTASWSVDRLKKKWKDLKLNCYVTLNIEFNDAMMLREFIKTDQMKTENSQLMKTIAWWLQMILRIKCQVKRCSIWNKQITQLRYDDSERGNEHFSGHVWGMTFIKTFVFHRDIFYVQIIGRQLDNP